MRAIPLPPVHMIFADCVGLRPPTLLFRDSEITFADTRAPLVFDHGRTADRDCPSSQFRHIAKTSALDFGQGIAARHFQRFRIFFRPRDLPRADQMNVAGLCRHYVQTTARPAEHNKPFVATKKSTTLLPEKAVLHRGDDTHSLGVNRFTVIYSILHSRNMTNSKTLASRQQTKASLRPSATSFYSDLALTVLCSTGRSAYFPFPRRDQ